MTQKGVKSQAFRSQTGKMDHNRKRAPGWTKQGFESNTIFECDMKTKRPDHRGNPK